MALKRLAACPEQNRIAGALREYGRIVRTLFMLDWIESPDLRRQATEELNKGEGRNNLARAVFHHRLGELRDRSAEAQANRASGLNLLTSASSSGTPSISNAPSPRPPAGASRSPIT